MLKFYRLKEQLIFLTGGLMPEKHPATPEERENALQDYELWWELPIRILGIIWLILLFYELIVGENSVVSVLIYLIWFLFILDFLARFFLSTDRIFFLKHNAITIISLVVPALRFLRALQAVRILRFGRSIRSLQLVTVIGSLNRGMKAIREFLGWHHSGYVMALTLIVILLGSAGMYAFEHNYPGSQGFETFWDSLWWTSMILTTIASQWWPVSPEGRILAFTLSLYSFGVFGFITAVITSFLIGKNNRK